ncbi:PREDICTED: putative Peroxidase 48 [Lupinus angustifolius]|uniref:putative Peroxidase 48 n=1 Tax=Lupinus angustifolius TaxID=3871 RepID=UPI00092EB0A8|nr:PREDICTED: putative Peroxidase 48 [Lupinus angustifolius]
MRTLTLKMDQIHIPIFSYHFHLFVLCLLLSFDNHLHIFHNNNNNTNISSQFYSSSSIVTLEDSFHNYPLLFSHKSHRFYHRHHHHHHYRSFTFETNSLEYDFYRDSCPRAEHIVRAAIRQLHRSRPSLVPAIIRLAFHDCFIQGCDASVLLDADDYIDSEKESPPNQSLKGFDVIETIKSKLEEACPGVVSCADILVLAARDCVALAGGPFYPLNTGRRDGSNSFSDIATFELPSPYGDLSETIASFKTRGFNEREMVTLLGSHSIGVIHCKFFQDRLYNFTGTNEPDPSLDTEFLKLLRSTCNHTNALSSSALGHSSHGSPSSLVEEPGVDMDFEQTRLDFGTVYYHSLLQGRGVLYADQQLTKGKATKKWIKAYAYDPTLFHRDFALAMMKLSDLRVLTFPMGQIRRKCSKIA